MSDTPETAQPTRAFNPNDHVIQLKSKEGAKDYLPVQYRLVWFRDQCPQGTIDTYEVEVDLDREVEAEAFVWNAEKRRSDKVIKQAKGYARFRAVVCDGKGGSATGTKSENAADFPDYIEKAETGAIGRALASLGFGTQFAPEFQEGTVRIVDAPVDRSQDTAGGTFPTFTEKESLSILSTMTAHAQPKQAPIQQQQQVQQVQHATKEEPTPSSDVAVLTPAGAMAQIQTFIAVMSPEYIVTLCKRLFEGKQPGELSDEQKVAFAQTLQKRAISFQLERLVDQDFKKFQDGYKQTKQSPLDLIKTVGTTLDEAEQRYLEHCAKLIKEQKAGLTEAFVSTHGQFLADIGIDPKHVKLLQTK